MEADQVRVGVWGDTVVLAMVSSDLAPNLADDLMTAYSKTVGGDLEVILKNRAFDTCISSLLICIVCHTSHLRILRKYETIIRKK